MSATNPILNTAADYLALPVSKPDYICRPIIPRQRLILFVGNSTQGKTPFISQMSRDIAAGQPVLDRFTCQSPSRVGFIDAESSGEDISLRLKMQEERKADVGDKLIIRNREQVYSEGFNLTAGGLKKLSAFAFENQLNLLVLDNLFALSGGLDVSKGNFVQPMLAGLKQIMSLPRHPSVVLCHHPRKGGTEDNRTTILDPNFMLWLEEASGSGTLVNLSDVRLGLERVEKNGEEFTVLRGRSRVPGNEQDIGPFYLRVDEDHAIATIDRSPQILAEQGEKIAAILTLLRSIGCFSFKDAIRKGCALDVKPSEKTVRRAVRFAREHGFVIETEGGLFQWV
ncbi:MAG: AAA family ATPase [Candidatus Acidiferrales bacterium]